MKNLLHILFCAALFSAGCADNRRVKPVFPGEHWEHIAPERAGFMPDRLAEFVKEVGGHGIIVRHGYVVKRWGHYAHLLDVSSACKPVYAHFVYMSIKEGVIRDLDEKVGLHQPDLGRINEPLGFKDREVTWRHLLQQTACYGMEELPGTAFNYSDYQAALLADTLVFYVHEVGYDGADIDILDKYLAGPLGFQDGATLHHERSHPGRLRISVRDFARFGLLYLNRGRWGRKQIVPRDLAVQAVSSPLPPDFPRTEQVETEMIENQRSLGSGANQERHLGSYSYTWWVNGKDKKGQRLLPALPEDAFLAQGHSGHDVLLVVPSLNLVACWIDAFTGRRHATRFSKEGYDLVNSAGAKLLAAMEYNVESGLQ
ncbi:MAG: hypothetical protein AB7T27_00815 [Kiritimatiellia bacterium]